MFVGIDAGSSYIKIAAIDKNRIVQLKKLPTSFGYVEAIKKTIPSETVKIVVTGYCRKKLSEELNCASINEIKAHSVGVQHLIPQAKTVIDVGGQDSKVIKLKEGGFSDFVMNDKCAAGTGRFLEMVAGRLNISIEKLSKLAERAKRRIQISSMCAVFAESEVISLLAQGEKVENIALAVFDSVAERVAALAKGFGVEPPVVATGGVALSPIYIKLLEEKIKIPVTTLSKAQFTGAIGCAFVALFL